MNQTFAAHQPQVLVHNSLSLVGINSDPVCTDYYPNEVDMLSETADSPIHSDLRARFDSLSCEAIKSNNKVPYPANKCCTIINISEQTPVQEESWSTKSIWSIKAPRNKDNIHRRLVIDADHSQGQQHVADRCKEFIY